MSPLSSRCILIGIMNIRAGTAACALVGAFGLLSLQLGAAPEHVARRPDRFAIILNFGYGDDAFPAEAAEFAKVLAAAREAHYNVILCKHTPDREELCQQHGLQMMVDLLVPDHHVYKNPGGAETLCRSLRQSKAVYGYHLWSDRMGGTVAGRNRDITNVRSWDPVHPTYVGDYHAREIGGLERPDLIGFYDFHWKRGGHWRHLLRAQGAARQTNSLYLKYVDGAPGKVGVGNFNRVSYSISMGVACGMKGYTFHHTGAEIDRESWSWNELGRDLQRVNAMIAPLGPSILELGNPTGIHSTVLTRTAKDRPIDGGAAVPPEFSPIPPDCLLHVAAGEVVMGVYRDTENRPAFLLANHNAYQPQEMVLVVHDSVRQASRFDREASGWVPLHIQDRRLRFELAAASVDLLRLETR